MNDDSQYIAGKVCVKCPEPAQYAGVDVKKAVYCKPCFINMVKNKFRSALSKRKVFRDEGERECLVIFYGDTSSCFLLHQIEEALQQVIYKRLMISPTFVILVSSLEDESISYVIKRFGEIRQVLPSAPWIIVHLAAGLTKNPVEINDQCQGLEQVPLLKEIMKFCNTATAKEEILRLLREKTCMLIARSLNINKIMLPDDGDALGRLTLAQLCLGRGGVLSEMTSVMEKRPRGIAFIRPLRDISGKEISIVSHLEGYEKSAIRTNEKNEFIPGSIQAATSTFMDNLFSEGFKATITTVLSTASKLHANAADIVCPLCELGAVEPNSDVCSCCLSLLSEINDPALIRNCLL